LTITKRTEEPKRLIARHGVRTFVIHTDAPEVGWSLLVHEGERCTHDFLQDTLEIAKRQALEDFGVPQNSWVTSQVQDS